MPNKGKVGEMATDGRSGELEPEARPASDRDPMLPAYAFERGSRELDAFIGDASLDTWTRLSAVEALSSACADGSATWEELAAIAKSDDVLVAPFAAARIMRLQTYRLRQSCSCSGDRAAFGLRRSSPRDFWRIEFRPP
jgi:hypothetical protein